jgi:DHA2 family methylenomycin A resistance protein-like MFS transporter
LAGIWLTARFAHETPSHQHGVDVRGQLAGIVALGALATATIEGGELGWSSAVALGGYALFVLAAASFVLVEARARTPMLPLSLFNERTFRSSTLIGLLVNVCFYGLIFVFSLLLQREQGLSALSTGLAFLPMTVAIGAAACWPASSHAVTKHAG